MEEFTTNYKAYNYSNIEERGHRLKTEEIFKLYLSIISGTHTTVILNSMHHIHQNIRYPQNYYSSKK
jgi:hypothetical protein